MNSTKGHNGGHPPRRGDATYNLGNTPNRSGPSDLARQTIARTSLFPCRYEECSFRETVTCFNP